MFFIKVMAAVVYLINLTKSLIFKWNFTSNQFSQFHFLVVQWLEFLYLMNNYNYFCSIIPWVSIFHSTDMKYNNEQFTYCCSPLLSAIVYKSLSSLWNDPFLDFLCSISYLTTSSAQAEIADLTDYHTIELSLGKPKWISFLKYEKAVITAETPH